VLGASAVFVALAVVAHAVAYFPIDLTITHALQSHHGVAFERLMYWLSWLGFTPQVDVLGAVIIVGLFPERTALRASSRAAPIAHLPW
jgi:hypothetical protein